ncbi:unnamed protein product [Gadus morhua 'NCC']
MAALLMSPTVMTALKGDQRKLLEMFIRMVHRAVGLPVDAVHSSDRSLLDRDMAAINRSNDPLKATCALEDGGRHPLLKACRPRDKCTAKGGQEGQHSEYAVVC